jgi:hypothetical protein
MSVLLQRRIMAVQGNMGEYDWGKLSRGASPPARQAGSGKGHVWLWLFVMLLLVGAFAAFCVYGPEQVREIGAAASEGAISGALWIIDGARGLMRRAGGQNPEDMGFERLADSNQDSLYAVP